MSVTKKIEPTLVDSFGRKVTYLRVSLTEACNFKCLYCVPPDGFLSTEHHSYLNREQILRLITLAASLGIYRVRLTGGEPLLRKDLLEIVRDIKKIPEIQDLSITSNGSKLKPLLKPLRDAGLDRINISLDSLDPKRFQKITLSNFYSQVLDSVHSALDMGFPMKLNMVILKGLSKKEILDFVQLAYDYPLEARFLEFMPLCGTGWSPELVISISEIRNIIQNKFSLVEELEREDQVAQTYLLQGGKGKLGFIGSLTESFCDQCSRIRMTVDGRIRPCLFSEVEVPLGHLLRQNAPDEEIITALQKAVLLKPAGNAYRDNPFNIENKYSIQQAQASSAVVMQSLGG